MAFNVFSKNGELLSMEQAVVPLSSIEYAYGFGVYETLRVVRGTVFFASDHIERLLNSATLIELSHGFPQERVADALRALVSHLPPETCNLKMLLVGAARPEDATLFILPLKPLFPDDALYKRGADCTLYSYERMLPHAKTLNMLGSYIAFREAKQANCYDALLTDRTGAIREGTRTNFFCLSGDTIVSPPLANILPGVTRKALLGVAEARGFSYREQDIRPTNLPSFTAAFLTSTSSKVMPIRHVGDYTFTEISPELKILMESFDYFLDTCGGVMPF